MSLNRTSGNRQAILRDEPNVLEGLALLVEDANRLKAMQSADRPGEASIADVRVAFADSIQSLLADGPSGAVTPSELLSEE